MLVDIFFIVACGAAAEVGIRNYPIASYKEMLCVLYDTEHFFSRKYACYFYQMTIHMRS